MKKLTILLFSILISFNSYGVWTKITYDIDENSYYIDTDTTKVHEDGYVYFLFLIDLLKPEVGYMSSKVYLQVDCVLNQFKFSSIINYKEPMGVGNGETDNVDNEWEQQDPDDTVAAKLIKYACEFVDEITSNCSSVSDCTKRA